MMLNILAFVISQLRKPYRALFITTFIGGIAVYGMFIWLFSVIARIVTQGDPSIWWLYPAAALPVAIVEVWFLTKMERLNLISIQLMNSDTEPARQPQRPKPDYRGLDN